MLNYNFIHDATLNIARPHTSRLYWHAADGATAADAALWSAALCRHVPTCPYSRVKCF